MAKEYKIKAMEKAAKQARKLLDEDKIVIIDDVFEYPEQIEIIKQEIPEARWITLESTKEICIKRDVKRKGAEDEQGYCGEDAIQYLYKNFLREPIKGEIKIETEEKTPKQILEEVKKNL
jgi:adenylylsulfate kinase-like enzyme